MIWKLVWSPISCLAILFLAGSAMAQTLIGPDIELRESAIVVASAPVLSNESGTLHIEASTLGELGGGRAVGASGTQLLSGAIPVPEPVAVWQLGSGVLGLLMLGRLRKRSSTCEPRDKS